MTKTEADQYESQGWPHIHIWYYWNHYYTHKDRINIHKCRCGHYKIKTKSGKEKVLDSIGMGTIL